MIIQEILDKGTIIAEVNGNTKEDVIKEMVGIVCMVHRHIVDYDRVVETLLARERLRSTAIEDGLAIPHGKFVFLNMMIAGFARSIPGIDCDSSDGKLTHFFFLLLSPENLVSEHLKTLAKISRMFKGVDFRNDLLAAQDSIDIYQLIYNQDKKLAGEKRSWA